MIESRRAARRACALLHLDEHRRRVLRAPVGRVTRVAHDERGGAVDADGGGAEPPVAVGAEAADLRVVVARGLPRARLRLGVAVPCRGPPSCGVPRFAPQWPSTGTMPLSAHGAPPSDARAARLERADLERHLQAERPESVHVVEGDPVEVAGLGRLRDRDRPVDRGLRSRELAEAGPARRSPGSRTAPSAARSKPSGRSCSSRMRRLPGLPESQ